MKDNIKYNCFALLICMATLLSSCSKFLDIKPEDKFLDEQVYANETTINQALNGVYMRLGQNALYGSRLTNTTVELLAQRYNAVAINTYTNFQTYNYTQANTMAAFDEIWSSAYSTILQVNQFISRMEQSSGVISEEKKSILKGEAYAIRAMLHFDLLRLFGPRYNTVDSVNTAIPYYTKSDAKLTALLPANAVMDSVLKDFRIAGLLLARDPIITSGVVTTLSNDNTDFYKFRNRRLNYFAVKGLQARALLYRGDKNGANVVAKAALNQGEGWFPWMPYQQIVGQVNNPDRIFSPEVLLGFQNPAMYEVQQTYFNSDISETNILAPSDKRLKTLFENNENDYRYTTTWRSASKSYRTFYKFVDIENKNAVHRYFQPVLRKTELYYIIAETEPNAASGIPFLNKVRFNRGLADLPLTVNINTEVQKEYQKEFFGEGQLFYYYKRLNVTLIPNAISTANVTMNAAKYVVPLPLSETELR